MCENLTVTIKLKPYLKEYIQCKFNGRMDERNNLIISIIKPFLERIPVGYRHKKNVNTEELLIIPLPVIDKFWDGKVYVSDENLENIERIIYAHFKDALFSYLDDKTRYTPEIKKCILQFCSDNNITFNSTNYDTLKKAYYRARKKHNIFKQTVPVMSLIFML